MNSYNLLQAHIRGKKSTFYFSKNTRSTCYSSNCTNEGAEAEKIDTFPWSQNAQLQACEDWQCQDSKQTCHVSKPDRCSFTTLSVTGSVEHSNHHGLQSSVTTVWSSSYMHQELTAVIIYFLILSAIFLSSDLSSNYSKYRSQC